MSKDSGSMIGHYHCIANEVEGKRGCASGDALAVYEHITDSGVEYDGYCYSCCQHFTVSQVHNSSVAVNLGIKDGVVVDKKNFIRKPKAEPITLEEAKNFIKKIGYFSNGYRGIKDEYNKFFGHLTKVDSNGVVIAQYYPETQDGKIVGYKCRNHPKDFRYGKLGQTGIMSDLSGEVKFKSGGKYVLIVGGECYSEDTEVLTVNGWKFFKDLSSDDLVMQVNNGIGQMVKPLSYIKKEYNGDMIHYQGRYNDIIVTPNHKMVSIDTKGNDYFHLAQDFPSRAHKYYKAINQSGEGVNLTDDQIRFIIAVAADCKVDTRKSGKRVAHFCFIKERKIKRLKELLDSLNLEYTEYNKENRNWECGRKYHTFNVTLPDWVEYKGLPLDWVTLMSSSQKDLFLDEIIYWDGNFVKDRNAFEFSSKLKHEAEMVANIAITNGRHAHLRLRKNELGEWYAVRVSNDKTLSSYQSINFNVVKYEGFVYCVEVPSGQLLVRRNNKVVVCGNCDKVAAYQMLRDAQIERGQGDFESIAVVSPTTGEPSAAKQIARRYDFLDMFDNIVIGMDNDEVGREAAKEIAKVLPEDKVKIVLWSGKDPNQMLLDGKQKQFVRDFYNAKPYMEDGIKSSSTMMDAVLAELDTPRLTLPEYMHKMQSNMGGGILDGTIVNVIADTSVGKSSHVNNMVYHWLFASPNPVTIISLEATEGQWGTDMLSLHLKTNLRWMSSEERRVFLSKPEVIERANQLWFKDNGEPRFYIIDEREGKIERIEKQLDRAYKQYGSRIMIIDVLTDILRGMDSDKQESHMLWQKMFVKRGVRLINVLHTRKPPKSKDGKPVPISEYDAYGSSTFVQSAAINILLERDKEAENPIEKNTTYVRMPKCRGGVTGACGEWYYDFNTRQCFDKDDYLNNLPNRTTLKEEEIISDTPPVFDDEVVEESF